MTSKQGLYHAVARLRDTLVKTIYLVCTCCHEYVPKLGRWCSYIMSKSSIMKVLQSTTCLIVNVLQRSTVWVAHGSQHVCTNWFVKNLARIVEISSHCLLLFRDRRWCASRRAARTSRVISMARGVKLAPLYLKSWSLSRRWIWARDCQWYLRCRVQWIIRLSLGLRRIILRPVDPYPN